MTTKRGTDESGLVAYSSEQEYLRDLRRVFQKDYGIDLTGDVLIEAAGNIDRLLRTVL